MMFVYVLQALSVCSDDGVGEGSDEQLAIDDPHCLLETCGLCCGHQCHTLIIELQKGDYKGNSVGDSAQWDNPSWSFEDHSSAM